MPIYWVIIRHNRTGEDNSDASAELRVKCVHLF